jgi:hypothetical protein
MLLLAGIDRRGAIWGVRVVVLVAATNIVSTSVLVRSVLELAKG